MIIFSKSAANTGTASSGLGTQQLVLSGIECTDVATVPVTIGTACQQVKHVHALCAFLKAENVLHGTPTPSALETTGGTGPQWNPGNQCSENRQSQG